MQKSAAKRKVEELLQSGTSLYRAGPEVGPVIDSLIAENPTADPGPGTLRLGQGTWEVFYAPHIAALSSTLGTRFQPLRYILEGDQLTSNVFYSSSLVQEGWLSSSGRLFSNAADTVEVAFDKFWVDIGSTKLRHSGTEGSSSGMKGAVDAAVNAIGRAAFFPQLAVFPVKYLDADLAVFSFPPLNDSLIAVRRLDT
ncbi:g11311 [Coccomyxa elongata]